MTANFKKDLFRYDQLETTSVNQGLDIYIFNIAIHTVAWCAQVFIYR